MAVAVSEQLGRAMPRRKNEKPPRARVTTNVDPAMLRKAKIVAAGRDMEMFDYIHSILFPAVERDYDKFIKDEHTQKRPTP